MHTLRTVLLCCTVAATLAPNDCGTPPSPYRASNLAVQTPGCHEATFTWTAPQQLPAQLRVLVYDRIVATLSSAATAYTLRTWLSPSDAPGVRVESIDASGARLAITPPVYFEPPECIVLPTLRLKVLLVNLLPPAGDPTPWTFAEVQDFIDSIAQTHRSDSLNRQNVVGDVSGYFGVHGSDYCVWSESAGQFTQCAWAPMFETALGVADQSVDFSQYDRVALLFSGISTGGVSFLSRSTNEGPIPVYSAPFKLTLHLHELGHLALAEESFRHGASHSGLIAGCANGPFPADPSNPLADCTVLTSSGDISPMTSAAGGSPSVHHTALHKERMGYLYPELVEVFDNRWLVGTEVDLYDINGLPGGGRSQLVRIRLDPFGYEYYLEYRNEVLLDGSTLNGTIVRLGTPDRGGNSVDSLNGRGSITSNQLVLGPARHVFDDPIQNVRVEWLGDLSGEGARLRISASSGTPSP